MTDPAVGVALGVATAAGLLDARSGRIPNVLTVPALVAGIVLGTPWGLLAALPLVRLFARRHAAGGDVKLAAAMGALLGIDGCVLVAQAIDASIVTGYGRFGVWVAVACFAHGCAGRW